MNSAYEIFAEKSLALATDFRDWLIENEKDISCYLYNPVYASYDDENRLEVNSKVYNLYQYLLEQIDEFITNGKDSVPVYYDLFDKLLNYPAYIYKIRGYCWDQVFPSKEGYDCADNPISVFNYGTSVGVKTVIQVNKRTKLYKILGKVVDFYVALINSHSPIDKIRIDIDHKRKKMQGIINSYTFCEKDGYEKANRFIDFIMNKIDEFDNNEKMEE